MSEEKKTEKVEKKEYKVLNPISHMGTRVERGEVIKLTEADAENIGDKYVKPYVKKDEDTDTDTADNGGDGNGGEAKKDSKDGGNKKVKNTKKETKKGDKK